MAKIEEVKRQLGQFEAVLIALRGDKNHTVEQEREVKERAAKELCLLFEPKPSGRLLTDEEIGKERIAYKKCLTLNTFEFLPRILKAQDAKTASIKDAEFDEERKRDYRLNVKCEKVIREGCEVECQARIEALIEKMKQVFHYKTILGDYFQMSGLIKDFEALKATHLKGEEG